MRFCFLKKRWISHAGCGMVFRLKREVIPINKSCVDTAELEKRLKKYLQSDEFSLDINELARDYQAQGLSVPPEAQLRVEAAAEARKCLETIMVCKARGHLWTEKADPENGRSELTCRRCGTTENLQW